MTARTGQELLAVARRIVESLAVAQVGDANTIGNEAAHEALTELDGDSELLFGVLRTFAILTAGLADGCVCLPLTADSYELDEIMADVRFYGAIDHIRIWLDNAITVEHVPT